ncbi:hypothetical protein FS749_009895, partial [Ceratobasidium sp. UAMH 11750]
ADSEGKIVAFDESEAGETKWIIRDWYYVIHPKPPAYHASWPVLIRATRDTLSKIVQKSTEWTSSWKIQIAEREGAAIARLARREMRRVRMWRRQEQEALVRGHIAEDVGIRWKEKGMGVKKRRVDKSRPGIGTRKVKSLRTSGRGAFREGRLSTHEPSAKFAPIRSTERRGKNAELKPDASRHKSQLSNAHSTRLQKPKTPAPQVNTRRDPTGSRPAGWNLSASIRSPKAQATSSLSKGPSPKPSSLQEPSASKAAQQRKAVARVGEREE